jgi:uncharacterized membrane protein
MCLNHVNRLGSRFLLVLCLFGAMTGCSIETYRGEAGSGYKVGIVAGPATVLVAVVVAMLGYFMWRRIRKR